MKTGDPIVDAFEEVEEIEGNGKTGLNFSSTSNNIKSGHEKKHTNSKNVSRSFSSRSQSSFEDALEVISADVISLLSDKRKDYGTANIMKSVIGPKLLIVSRIDEKLNRIVNLLDKEPQNESLEDSVNDIIGLGLLLRLLLEGNFELPLRENHEPKS